MWPQTLTVLLYDKSTAEAVEKAIASSPLGLQPRVEGDSLVVPIPAPGPESRAAAMKLAAGAAEAARASVRRLRQEAMDKWVSKKSPAAEGVGEDDLRRRDKEIQAMTDAAVKDVAAVLSEKERELKAV